MTGAWPPGPPPDRPHAAASTRALADLARAGYRVLDEPSMQVEFEIRHGHDRPGDLADTLSALTPATAYSETLCTAAHGGSLIVGTRVGDSRVSGPPGTHRPPLEVDAAGPRIVFRGSDRPNLSFRHESAEQFMGIISIEDEPKKMLLRHGLAVLETLRHIAETAVQAGDAPLTVLQCPAQLPPTNTFQEGADIGVRAGEPARSSSMAIRFSMALDRPTAVLRLQIADRLARHCAERGLGLWLGDTRPGYRAGNWFLVVPHNRPLARRHYPRAADRGAGNAAEGFLPVTLVGPARPGSTHAILSFLAQFPEIGVLGCSMNPLNELAFLHLKLAVNGASRPRLLAVNAAVEQLRGSGGGLQDVLAQVVTQLLGADRPAVAGLDTVERLVGRAGDYRPALGPALPVVVDNVVRRIPIWVSWQLRDGNGPRLPLVALQRALDRLALTDPDAPAPQAVAPSTEYVLARQVDSAISRGRGKIAISKNLVERRFPGPPGGSARLCAELQDAWADELEADGHVGRPGELSVSAHESWLGQGVAAG